MSGPPATRAGADDVTDADLGLLLLIRHFERALLELFSRGEVSGTTHTCLGQEYIPVALAPLLEPHDVAAAARYLRGSGPTWQACRLRAPVTVVTSGPGAGTGGLPWHAARVTSAAIDDLGPFVNGAAVAAAAELIVRIGQT